MEIIVVADEDGSELEAEEVVNCTSYNVNSASYANGNICSDSSSGVMDGRYSVTGIIASEKTDARPV